MNTACINKIALCILLMVVIMLCMTACEIDLDTSSPTDPTQQPIKLPTNPTQQGTIPPFPTQTEHSHTYSQVIKAATCTEDGYSTFTCQCGDSYVENVVKAPGHAEVIDAGIAPTKTEDGLSDGKHCSVCGMVLVQQQIAYATGSVGLTYGYFNDTTKTCMVVSLGTCTDSDIIIPVIHNGYAVAAICFAAFKGCDEVTSVTVLEGFNGFTIDTCAFFECENLTSVILPEGVTYISESAFHWCEKLAEINIPESIIYIGEKAFFGCKITHFTIPDGVREICEGTFMYCSCLTDLTIGKNVASIGEDAFLSCRGLTTITIPNSVRSIGKGVFTYCDKLATIIFDGTMQQWNAIRKHEEWTDMCRVKNVVCTDGTIPVDADYVAP